MNKKQFLKKMNEFTGDDKNLFILCCGLMNNNKIQSVNDIEQTLGLKFKEDEIISLNKYMFSVTTYCKWNKVNMVDYLTDEYFNLMTKVLK